MPGPVDTGNKPPCSREDALAVLQRLREAGHVAYFAGGCVRDLLLGLEPKDYDVATDAPPDRVRQLFSNTQAVGAAFGVILVKHRKSIVEVATFRTEGTYEDGRRPAQVRFTTAEEDAQRRDFTINGLFLDPIENKVIDFVGGQEDLRQRRLRAIGDAAQRFAEDHLRLLRAVRFAARFSLQIEPATAKAILRDAPLLKRISPERIAEELRLMLGPPTRNAAWSMLWQFRLIPVIYRFLAPTLSLPEQFDASRSIFLHLPDSQSISFGLGLAAGTLCVHWQSMPADADLRPLLEKKPIQQMVHAMRQALRISNDESDRMREILMSLGPLLAEPVPRVATMKRLLALPSSADFRLLLDAMRAAGLYGDRIEWLQVQLAELSKSDCSPRPLLTGDDLVAAGLTPGPAFKKILEAVYDAQLEGAVTSKPDALAMALRLAEPR